MNREKRSEIEWNEINFRIGFDGEKKILKKGWKIHTHGDKIFKGKSIEWICMRQVIENFR